METKVQARAVPEVKDLKKIEDFLQKTFSETPTIKKYNHILRANEAIGRTATYFAYFNEGEGCTKSIIKATEGLPVKESLDICEKLKKFFKEGERKIREEELASFTGKPIPKNESPYKQNEKRGFKERLQKTFAPND